MTKDDRETIARRTLSYSNADTTEVLVATQHSALTRFTHGISNQNVASANALVSVRAIVDGQTGVAGTNHLDDASLEDTVKRAIAMAALAPSDPALAPLPSGGATKAPHGAYVAATATADPFVRAKICDAIFDETEKAGFWSAGFAATATSGYTVANTRGVLASFDGTDASVNVKMTAKDSTGFAEAYTTNVEAIDAAAIGHRACEKARTSASPRAIEPGHWTVILEPAAFGELMRYLTGHFSAQSFDEGSSFCSDGLDRSYFPENVTIGDDYAHPLAPGMPFDFEGQPKQRLTLVDAGVVRNIVTDSYYAHKLNRPNTGHALPAPNAHGPQVLNLTVAPGTHSAQELVANTTRGLLITRFWYIRTVDPKRAIVTGMTRDGTFLIEHGRIAGGVHNLRFNQSILEALRHATFANDQHRTSQYDFSAVVPTVKIDGFNFTSTTEF